MHSGGGQKTQGWTAVAASVVGTVWSPSAGQLGISFVKTHLPGKSGGSKRHLPTPESQC